MILIIVLLIVVLGVPFILSRMLDVAFMIWVLSRNGKLYPMDSAQDNALVEQEAKIWYDPLYRLLRPFCWWTYFRRD